jgi:hypothetical protein
LIPYLAAVSIAWTGTSIREFPGKWADIGSMDNWNGHILLRSFDRDPKIGIGNKVRIIFHDGVTNIMNRYWTILNHIATWGCIAMYFIYLMVYGVFWDVFPWLNVGEDLYFVFFNASASGSFYFVLIFMPLTCLIRDIVWK